jgi:hypothetical protein
MVVRNVDTYYTLNYAFVNLGVHDSYWRSLSSNSDESLEFKPSKKNLNNEVLFYIKTL